ncbi:MAG: hypothetical protein EOO65_05990 [Methanosarcinales archaeon]|nr:MAG: hypothetical protein EOO65_05990 [Methanosarcinales archaeon]
MEQPCVHTLAAATVHCMKAVVREVHMLHVLYAANSSAASLHTADIYNASLMTAVRVVPAETMPRSDGSSVVVQHVHLSNNSFHAVNSRGSEGVNAWLLHVAPSAHVPIHRPVPTSPVSIHATNITIKFTACNVDALGALPQLAAQRGSWVLVDAAVGQLLVSTIALEVQGVSRRAQAAWLVYTTLHPWASAGGMVESELLLASCDQLH